MILEIVDIRIVAGLQVEFELALQRGLDELIAKANGFQGFKVNHSIETPERYLLSIFWETLEHHTVEFRGSPAMAQWRAIVSPYFAAAPMVEHFTLTTKSA